MKGIFIGYEDYFQYFENTWLKGYPLRTWNYWHAYEKLKDNFKMTNNIVEGFHHLLLHLNRYCRNPSLGTFLVGFSYLESRQLFSKGSSQATSSRTKRHAIFTSLQII